ncbi:MAG TPA: PAS domain S-box protein [Bryobacteraceae bacterium]|jgi:PAS domain S-box-containing protein|nr:PAS domain S-box protein [Bryobacteraceae bacterium]
MSEASSAKLSPVRAGVRLLIVDDNEKTRTALTALLSELADEVICVPSGEEALRKALTADFACILLDVQLPGISGLELAELLRSREILRNTPIIFLTGHDANEAVARAYRLGAVDFLSKPVVPDMLRSKVSVFAELARRDAENRALAATIEKERALLRAVLDNIEAGVVACDAQGTLTLFNRATREIHGTPQEAIGAEHWAEKYDLFRSDGVTRLSAEQVPLNRALREGEVRDAEMVVADRSGQRRAFLASGRAMRTPDGELIGAVVAMHDITERKETTERLEAKVRERTAELRASEERYRAFVAQSSEGIYRFELREPLPISLPVKEQLERAYRDAYLAECNDAMARMYGYSAAAELEGASLENMLAPSDPRNIAYLTDFITSGYRLTDAESHEYAVDGQRRIFSNSLVGIVEEGHLLRVWGTQRDITAQRISEAALREREAELALITDSMPVMVSYLGADERYLRVNRAYEQFLNRRRDEIIGKPVREVVGDAYYSQIRSFLARAFAGERLSFDGRLVRHDGALREIEFSYTPNYGEDGTVCGIVALAHDTTERKWIERRDNFLVGLDDAVRSLSNAANITEVAARRLGEHLQVNRCCYAEVESDQETYTIVGNYCKDVPSIVGRYGLSQFGAEFSRSMLVDRPCVVSDVLTDPRFVDVRESHEATHIRAAIWVPLFKAGRLAATMAVHHAKPRAWTPNEVELVQAVASRCWESMERARIGRELRESERQFRAAVAGSPFPLMLHTSDGEIIALSRSWTDLTEYRDDELETHQAWMRRALPDRYEEIESLIDSELSHSSEFRLGEVRVLTKSGSIRIWDLRVVRLGRLPDGRRLLMSAADDLTERARAEAAVRESEARFRNLADNSPVMVWVTDAEGYCTYLNRHWMEFTGQFGNEGLGMGWLNATHPEDRDEAERQFLDANGRKAPFRVEYRLRRTDGQYRWAIDSALPRFGPDGTFHGYVGSVIDITERKEMEEALRESEARFRQLADAVPAFVWVSQPDGSITYFNDRWFVYTGLTPQECADGRWSAVLHPDDLERTLHAWARARTERIPYEAECRYRRADGTYRWFMARALPVHDANGSIVQWFGTSTDIHDAKRAEEALRRANSELEEFAFVSSHDLQEPLRMVNIYTQLLLRSAPVQTPEAVDYAEFIHRGVTRMEALIRDLLSYSRAIHTDEWLTTTTKLSEVLQQALLSLHARIEESNAKVTWEGLPEVRGDTAQLTHVFQNLLSNSLKYRHPERNPEIHISAREERDHWIVSVCDNGIGFEPKYADRIFGLFKRLHKDAYPGTGLGLAICQRIVKRHGGRMWAEGALGTGATFYFELQKAGT